METRVPSPALRPFVETLWASDSGSRHPPGTLQERVLPTGMAHIVLRLDSEPLRIHEGDEERVLPAAIVGGPRTSAYLKDVRRPVATVGAMLAPGAVACVLGVPASELSGQHTPLELLWGAEAHRLADRLASVPDTSGRLDLFTAHLEARLPRVRGLHAGIAAALDAARGGVDRVSALAETAGLGPRRFGRLFQESVGVPPKRWVRLRRFQRTLFVAKEWEIDWASAAVDLGYADQPHLVRDFRAFSGLTPGEYRRRAPVAPNHVPDESNALP